MNSRPEKHEKLESILKLVNRSEISSIKSIVSGIIRIINDPDSTIRDLKEIVEVDPPLTTKVLMVANSAYYAPRNKIGDIKQALIWIGFDTLKELALSQKVCSIFNGNGCIEGYSRDLLWKHSVAVALFSKMLYRREFRESGANAYVAGLLHDIGLIVEDQFLQSGFKEVLKISSEKQINLSSAEQKVFGFNHAEVGMAITSNWKLPGELSVAIGYHDDPLAADPAFFKLAATLYVAEYFSRQYDLGYSDTRIQDHETFQECLTALDVEPHALDLIVEDVRQELSKMAEKGLF
ncbi:MAG: HDOD domain-containing protein [Proteobacteria bacterium]|nr:HDOD domain-containing protein [Pseudomonadota bacterium]